MGTVIIGKPENLAVLLDYDGNGQLIYQGKAAIGSASSTASWQIKKLAWTGGQMSSMKWADGNDDFDNIWDNRAGLSYS